MTTRTMPPLPDPALGSITLADVAERTDMLAVACSLCERAGRFPLSKLIERHDPVFTVPMLLRELSADCQKRRSMSAYDLCGILFSGDRTLPAVASFG